MKAIYNSRILPQEEINLETVNRAFCYGDGLFETIVTGPDRINLLTYHMARISKATRVLDLEIPFDTTMIPAMLEQLKLENGLEADCRFRLQLWRNSGGLYTPDVRSASYMITVNETSTPFYDSIDRISVSKMARVVKHALSFAKTMSALPYVLAGVEKRDSAYADLVIRDSQENIAETIASNIFWTRGEKLYTPSLQTGCISGTMRNYLLDALRNHGKVVKEVVAGIETLQKADSVFLTNASGIRWVSSFENQKEYQNPTELLQPVFRQPLQP